MNGSGEVFYEKCSVHKDQHLQIVCTICEEASLCCPICIDNYHIGHPIISLKKFICSQIPKLYQAKPQSELINHTLDTLKGNFLEGFEKMRKGIGSQINDVQEVYEKQLERLKSENAMICQTDPKSFTAQNITAVKRKLKAGMKIPGEEQLVSEIERIGLQVEFLLSEATKIICKTISELTEYWEITSNILLGSRIETQHRFSNELKHSNIELKTSQNSKTPHDIAINSIFDGKYHISVAQPALNPIKNKVRFKISQSANNCVWIGACDLDKVKEKGFENCYKKGEGCYWIWQSGGDDECQFYSSLRSESIVLVIDSRVQEEQLNVGDTVEVQLVYAPQIKMNVIKFSKIVEKDLEQQCQAGNQPLGTLHGQGGEKDNNEEESEQESHRVAKILIYEGKVEKKQLHACVALGDEDEAVAIVNSSSQ